MSKDFINKNTGVCRKCRGSVQSLGIKVFFDVGLGLFLGLTFSMCPFSFFSSSLKRKKKKQSRKMAFWGPKSTKGIIWDLSGTGFNVYLGAVGIGAVPHESRMIFSIRCSALITTYKKVKNRRFRFVLLTSIQVPVPHESQKSPTCQIIWDWGVPHQFSDFWDWDQNTSQGRSKCVDKSL